MGYPLATSHKIIWQMLNFSMTTRMFSYPGTLYEFLFYFVPWGAALNTASIKKSDRDQTIYDQTVLCLFYHERTVSFDIVSKYKSDTKGQNDPQVGRLYKYFIVEAATTENQP